MSIMNFDTSEQFTIFVEEAINRAGLRRITLVKVNDASPFECFGFLDGKLGNVISIRQRSPSDWTLFVCSSPDRQVKKAAETLEKLLDILSKILGRMQKIADCERCQMNAHSAYVVCAIHPFGPDAEKCPDFAPVAIAPVSCHGPKSCHGAVPFPPGQ